MTLLNSPININTTQLYGAHYAAAAHRLSHSQGLFLAAKQLSARISSLSVNNMRTSIILGHIERPSVDGYDLIRSDIYDLI